jgi:hypothetical protein
MTLAASGGSARPPASRPTTAPANAASRKPAGGLRRRPPAASARSRPAGSVSLRRPPRPAHLHHDQAAHDRARRRYDGLHAKAASTGFPEEAAACRAKAEQLRAKYGL